MTERGFAVYAGLDEAGYGPMLGPLTLGFSAFRTVAGDEHDWEPSWERLAPAVSDQPGRDKERLVVADSKRVFTRNPRGFRRLESTVLAFLVASGGGDSWADLMGSAPSALQPPVDLETTHPWYGAAPKALPLHADSGALADHAARLDQTLETTGTQVAAAGVAVIPAGVLNASFEATDNKGATLWSYHSKIIADLFDRYGREGLDMTCDRLGGRARYAGILSALLPFSDVRRISESRVESRYLVTSGDASMRIRFVQKGDSISLPVALGSCFAKYAREVVMDAFNGHFAAICPGVRPTAGYVTDARRWLAEVEATRPGALPAPGCLVRNR